MWNVVDFITNSLYVATIGLRLRAYYDVSSFSGSTWVLWCTITTFMPAHLLLGKSGGRNEGPTFQRPHRHHISNAFRLIFQKTYNSKVSVSKNQNIKVGICKNYLFILCEDWERRFVSRQRQRQMLGDKMTNPGLSFDKSRRLSGLDIARSAAGSPFNRAEQAGHVLLKGFPFSEHYFVTSDFWVISKLWIADIVLSLTSTT